MTYIEIEVHGPKEDLHSGFWGGATHNPALALVEILGKLYNPDNTIAVPGFYDDVVALTDDERAMIAKTALTEEQFKAVHRRAGGLGRCAYTFASASRRGRRWTSTACGAAGRAPDPRRSSRPRRAPRSAAAWSAIRTRTRSTDLLKQLHRVDCAADRDGRGQPADHRQAGAVPLRQPGDAGGGARLRERAGAHSRSSRAAAAASRSSPTSPT